MEKINIGKRDDIPQMGARTIETEEGRIAIFRTSDDQFFAIKDSCPHRGGPLAQGIVHGHRVTCPLHNWVIDLENGEATGADTGCTQTYKIEQDGDVLYLSN